MERYLFPSHDQLATDLGNDKWFLCVFVVTSHDPTISYNQAIDRWGISESQRYAAALDFHPKQISFHRSLAPRKNQHDLSSWLVTPSKKPPNHQYEA
jgi:hypothetical protein